MKPRIKPKREPLARIADDLKGRRTPLEHGAPAPRLIQHGEEGTRIISVDPNDQTAITQLLNRGWQRVCG